MTRKLLIRFWCNCTCQYIMRGSIVCIWLWLWPTVMGGAPIGAGGHDWMPPTNPKPCPHWPRKRKVPEPPLSGAMGWSFLQRRKRHSSSASQKDYRLVSCIVSCCAEQTKWSELKGRQRNEDQGRKSGQYRAVMFVHLRGFPREGDIKWVFDRFRRQLRNLGRRPSFRQTAVAFATAEHDHSHLLTYSYCSRPNTAEMCQWCKQDRLHKTKTKTKTEFTRPRPRPQIGLKAQSYM